MKRSKHRLSTRRAVEDQVRSCYSTWSRSYYDDYYGTGADYPPVHRDIIRRLIRRARARRVLDAGCGPASLLRALAADGMDVYGFDLTQAMVDEGRRVLLRYGVPPDHLWKGSVLSRRSFGVPGRLRPIRFDAAICVGVLPHVPASDDRKVLRHLRDAVRPGGLVAVEARNQLFALYTLNRYSYEFFANELVRATELERASGGSRDRVATALNALRERFRLDLPPLRRGAAGEPGYDEVLSRTHNPLLLREQFSRLGFRDVHILFYHYHALPPMFEALLPDVFRRRSLAMEDPADWRGHFMASAFIVAGRVR